MRNARLAIWRPGGAQMPSNQRDSPIIYGCTSRASPKHGCCWRAAAQAGGACMQGTARAAHQWQPWKRPRIAPWHAWSASQHSTLGGPTPAPPHPTPRPSLHARRPRQRAPLAGGAARRGLGLEGPYRPPLDRAVGAAHPAPMMLAEADGPMHQQATPGAGVARAPSGRMSWTQDLHQSEWGGSTRSAGAADPQDLPWQ